MLNKRGAALGLTCAMLLAVAGCAASSLDVQVKSEVKTASLEPLQIADKPVVACHVIAEQYKLVPALVTCEVLQGL